MLENGMILIDRYEILCQIGVGGMSQVYKAKDNALGRIVAIKVLKSEFSEDLNFVTKFRTEAQSAAGLEHPNIVNVYDVGSENGLHFIVMEHVEGITLKTYIEKKGQLTFKEATSIAIQVARGIEAAHNKNIIHRDIKPQNIIISTEGKVKVTDFGIARAISSNTISAEVMGSVHYASPEQARNSVVDGRSDIYSLGIVMYEMVTGRVPFDGDTTVAVAIQHLQEDMVEPSVYAPDLPISYEKIILKATQKNADRRYQLIEELLIDLRKALANPEEDFVVIAPAAISKTRVIGGEELETIQNTAANVDLEKESTYASNADDDEDEEENKTANPILDRIVNIALIVVAIVILGAAVWLGSNIYNLFKNPSDTERPSQPPVSSETETGSEDTSAPDTSTEEENLVEVPSIMGWDVEQATVLLEAKGLQIFVMGVKEPENETQVVGQICYQSEAEGNMVKKGTTVQVQIYGYNDLYDLPSVEGLTEEEAVQVLEEAGFSVEKDYQYNEEIEKGYAVSRKKKPNTPKTVILVISEGKAPVRVPNTIIGEGLSVAQYELVKNLGFVLSEPIYEYKEGVASGAIYDVWYTNDLGESKSVVGQEVPYGATLQLYINTGIKLVNIPSEVLGADFESVQEQLEMLGFVLTITEENNDEYEQGIVFDVQVNGVSVLGTSIAEGSEIKVYVSLGKEDVTIPSELAGRKFAEVLAELEELGFYVQKLEVADASAAAGTVYDIRLNGDSVLGTKATPGSTLQVYVNPASGEETTYVYSGKFEAPQSEEGKPLTHYVYTLKDANGNVIDSSEGAYLRAESGSKVEISAADVATATGTIEIIWYSYDGETYTVLGKITETVTFTQAV